MASSTGSKTPIMPALEALLQQTANVAANADPLGLPSIERGVDQLVEATARLAKRSSQTQQTNEALSAARLLASEGIDTQLLNRDLREVEIQPTLEEILPETCTLEEWLAQVQEISILSAVRDSQASTQEYFKQKLSDITSLEWQNARNKFVLSSQTPQANVYETAPNGSDGATGMEDDRDPTISPRASAFIEVVKKINRAMASGIPYDALRDIQASNEDMKERERSAGAQVGSHTSLQSLWQVVTSVLSPARAGHQPESKEEIASMRAALCKSARRHLERDYATYVNEEIEHHPQLAMLGGSPSRLQQIRAFLRIRFSDKGALDFDMAGGIDTFWHQLYFCFRCGYIQEAIELVESVSEGLMAGDVHAANVSSLPDYIREWQEKGELSVSNQAMVRLDGERILREQDRSNFGKNQYRVLIYTILCADRHLAENVLSDQYLFTNIEDFLWFKLVLVREGQLTTLTSSTYTHEEPHRLAELQQQLAQYPANYYTRDGKEPLLYAILLLLTLQFEGAIQYLATYTPSNLHGDSFPFAIEAVHLCIIFSYYGVFNLGTDIRSRGSMLCSDIVHDYGQNFAVRDPATAFEYYCLAAEVKGGGYVSIIQTQGQLLRELLNQSRAFGTLLGAGGSGSGAVLSKLKPDRQQRQDIIVSAAVGCVQNAQFHEAMELFMHAGKPFNALEIINKRYSDAISATEESQGISIDDLEQRGNAALAELEGQADVDIRSKREETNAFEMLILTRKLFQAFKESNYKECFQLLPEFAFLPIRSEQVSKYASDAGNLHIAIKEKLPQIVKIAGIAISEMMQERRAIQRTPTAASMISSSTQELKMRLHSLALYAGYVKIIPENVATELNIILNGLI
ncbi:Nup93/Nic96 nucleoporin [Chloropicon primus]|uniref:Nuclear pore protein n=1 Tax=Chloropicon primus TaxID=1764295 RepID=A0A5B8MNC8_9CHLO|nr:Nup93/Nic96 nucleoporin [Chloropicon primus]UPR00022.1 Nup93/Nic96 nucleoporin [Chloropicon primus]|eukprot:QDZ20810.1 Nup93/Nic96 nucleoporin [Chloropicon primus]